MSQIYASVSSTPSVSTSFTTDDGTAIPAANNIDILGRDTTENNVNGIQTVADPANGDRVFIELTNRFENRTTVVGATTGDIVTFNLGIIPAVYRFRFSVAGRETTSGDGVGYTIFATARTDGATATLISTEFSDADEDASLSAALMDLVISGNNAILRATGVAGQTIAYSTVGEYVQA